MNDKAINLTGPVSFDQAVEHGLLDDYLDGVLSDELRRSVAELLLRSDQARTLLEQKKHLLAELRELPLEAGAERDLWPAIAARSFDPQQLVDEGDTAAAERRQPLRPSWGAARLRSRGSSAPVWRSMAIAAMLLIAVGVGFHLGRSQGPSAVDPDSSPNRPQSGLGAGVVTTAASPAPTVAGPGADIRGADTRNAMSQAESALLEVKLQLRASMGAYRSVLPPQTLHSIDANLETIERAITEVRIALEANPDSPRLRRALVHHHENEIALLQRVTRAASRL